MEILWPLGYIMLDCLDFQIGPLSLIYHSDNVMMVIARNLHYKNIFLAMSSNQWDYVLTLSDNAVVLNFYPVFTFTLMFLFPYFTGLYFHIYAHLWNRC